MNPLVQSFREHLNTADIATSGPSRLAAAARSALSADATVVSLLTYPSLQLPIGYDGPDAALAEQLQFSIQNGPARDAQQLGLPLIANTHDISACWPTFHHKLVQLTSLRSVASIPLQRGTTGIGVLDFYFNHHLHAATFPIDAAQHIGDLILDRLHEDQYLTRSHEPGPAWLVNHATQPRGQVSVAMGTICLALHVTAEQSLQLLRDHAQFTDITVDDAARLITNGTLKPHQLPHHTTHIPFQR